LYYSPKDDGVSPPEMKEGVPMGFSRTEHRGRLGVATCLTSLAALALAAGALAGVRSDQAAKPPTTVSGTFHEWNWDLPVDDPGEHAMLAPWLKAIEKKFPKAKIVNTSMTLSAQNDKLPLAFASSSSAPTLSQTNEGLQNQGRLVQDNLITPLDEYDQIYHWTSRIGKSSLSLAVNSWPDDKKMFGSGHVYAIPETGTVVGIFYNKKLLAAAHAKPPTSWATFVKDLALAKKAGQTPIAYAGGQPTAFQPSHVLWMLINQNVAPAKSLAFVSHKGQATIDTPAHVRAATTFLQWTKAGYFPKSFQGLSADDALNMFDQGKATFFIEGNWYAGAVWGALHNGAGFWAPPVVTGGPGEGWSIPTKSPNPDLAAAMIDLTLSPAQQAVLLKNGDIPIIPPSKAALAKATPLLQSAEKIWNATVKAKNVVPYMDWAYPDFLNQAMSGIAELQAGKTSPGALMSSLQSQYKSYWNSH
jgi:raffinose/stachyose/melibiose transport system substrate-binding protein